MWVQNLANFIQDRLKRNERDLIRLRYNLPNILNSLLLTDENEIKNIKKSLKNCSSTIWKAVIYTFINENRCPGSGCDNNFHYMF